MNIAYALGIGNISGFLIGWLVLKRPQWATNLINKGLAKIGLGGANVEKT